MRNVFILTCALLIAVSVILIAGQQPQTQETMVTPVELTAPAPIRIHIPEEPDMDGIVYSDEIPLSYGLQLHAQLVCREYGVPYGLMLGLMETESSFREDADSGWAFGLCQIGYINEDWLAEQGLDIRRPVDNIEAAGLILGDYLNRYDVPQALMAYNCGEYGAQELWADGINETEYSRSVMAAAEKWEETIHDRP